MLANKILILSVISLVFLGIGSYAFAAEVTFDQSPIVMEHSGFLIIEDTSIPNSASITAEISSGNQEISVTLDRQYADTFKSNFIKFTTGPSEDLYKLQVGVGSTINVNYDGTMFSSIATIVSADGTLDSMYDSVDTFRLAASRGCSDRYGGDADKDGICDNWETGSRLINYPRGSTYSISCDPNKNYDDDPLGAEVCPDPTKKDIFVEIDYMAGHAPNIKSLEQVVASFNNAPSSVSNPFQLHVIVDEEILPHINAITFPGTSNSPGFDHIKAKEFGTDAERNDPKWSKNHDAKAQIFYYYLWAHDQSGSIGTSGVAEEKGNDGGVTLGSFDGFVGNEDQQAGTFMHELGHNLGIDHGGDKTNEDNCKPNLLSVMSYSRQFSDLVPDRSLDYSRQSVGTSADSTSLGMENNLVDSAGISSYPDANSQIVFGIGNGMTQLENTDQTNIDWPSSWNDLRFIKDSQGLIVCDSPSTAVNLDSINQWEEIDMATKNSHWREGRSSNQISSPQSLSLQTDNIEYFSGETIYITGRAPSQVPDSVNMIIKSPNGNIVMIDQISLQNDNSFSKTINSGGAIWQPDTEYILEVSHGKQNSISLPINFGNDSDRYVNDLDQGKWCFSTDEAKSFAKQHDLKEKDFLDIAPLCSNPLLEQENEINMSNVRAARSVNVDNVLGIIQTMKSDNDFVKPSYKSDLVIDLKNIRKNVLKDDMFEVLNGYIDLKTSVNTKVANEKVKQQLLEVLDRNIDSTSHAVPEFETIAILVLIVSITSIIVISRRSSFITMTYK